MIHHPFFVDPSLSLRGDILVRRAAETKLPVEPEALAELISRNRLAPQAHLDAIDTFVLAARLSLQILTNPGTARYLISRHAKHSRLLTLLTS